MAKSRTAPWLVAALVAAPAGAQSDEVDRAIAGQRAGLRAAMRLDCPPAGDDSEIVVCGSRAEDDRRHRLPLAGRPPPGAADRAGGEQRAAMAIDTSRCTAVGRDQQCTSGLDVIGIGFTIARAVGQALLNRD